MNETNDNNVAATKQAYSEIYQQYASNNTALNEDVKQNLDRFITHLSGKKVLDVGCASGRESEYMYARGLTVEGCDISEEFVRLAQERCPECSFFVADMRRIEREANTYDGIWANASFLHIPKTDAPATLKSFGDMLTSNGILYLSVMKGDFDGLRENKQMHWPERHFSDYHESELDTILEKAGFETIDKQSNESGWGPIFLHYFCKKS